jgi:hypothetical protein
MTTEPLDLQRVREVFEGRIRTHYDGCIYAGDHPRCAIHALCDEVERLRATCEVVAGNLRNFIEKRVDDCHASAEQHFQEALHALVDHGPKDAHYTDVACRLRAQLWTEMVTQDGREEVAMLREENARLRAAAERLEAECDITPKEGP